MQKVSKHQRSSPLGLVALGLVGAGVALLIAGLLVGQYRADHPSLGQKFDFGTLTVIFTAVTFSLGYFPLFLASAILGARATRIPDRSDLAAGSALGIGATLAVLSALPFVFTVISIVSSHP